jgi:hypothetical protein
MQHLKKLDIDSLKEYAFFLVDLILSVYPKSQKKEIAFLRKSYKEVIENTYSRGSRTGLKSAIGELEIQMKYFGAQFLGVVNVEISKRFGFDISQKKDTKRADKIVERGYIKTEKEYRFLFEYFQIIGVDKSIGKQYLKKIANILEEYNIG